ncbi:hypothetical protein [Streptomyces sp. NPDC098781]|uniref:hypothetical protein n=1 Tax=Streptomyces sp. NPDC098781 TaxID=3366097 RepID=UPI003807B068
MTKPADPTPTPTGVDPYRLSAADGSHGASSPAVTGWDIARTLLWATVVISAVANMAASYGSADTWIHLVCGMVTVLAAGTLVVRGLRGRR